jgi:hypothetical protein
MIVGIVMVEVELRVKMSSFEFDISSSEYPGVHGCHHPSQVEYVPQTSPPQTVQTPAMMRVDASYSHARHAVFPERSIYTCRMASMSITPGVFSVPLLSDLHMLAPETHGMSLRG